MKDFTYTDSETQKEYKFSLREPTISEVKELGFTPSVRSPIRISLSDVWTYVTKVITRLESGGNDTDITNMSYSTWIHLAADILKFMPASHINDIRNEWDKKINDDKKNI